MQYLIQNDSGTCSLWKFKCFDKDAYPYNDVLKLVYQIDSAKKISEIEVNPAEMDNTDSGRAAREEIGTLSVTERGDKIDGLKYTAASNMFYEFSGIAYNQLSEEDAARICEILHIEKTAVSENPQPSSQEEPAEVQHTEVTLEYITGLQSEISAAMLNHELPFVTSSAVYENPYRLHVTVTSDKADDLSKLKAFDTIGGALEIEYSQELNFLE